MSEPLVRSCYYFEGYECVLPPDHPGPHNTGVGATKVSWRGEQRRHVVADLASAGYHLVRDDEPVPGSYVTWLADELKDVLDEEVGTWFPEDWTQLAERLRNGQERAGFRVVRT